MTDNEKFRATCVMLQRLINKVNMVTVTHRHQGEVTDGALVELYDRQILAEKFLEKILADEHPAAPR